MSKYGPCTHCGLDAVFEIEEIIEQEKLIFCCYGCQSVYHILQSSGLSDYYDLLDDQKVKRTYSQELYGYLDDEKFQSEFGSISEGSCEGLEFEFYLEGVHCLACLWLIEKVPSLHAGVESTDLNMSSSIVKVQLKKGALLSEVAQVFAKLGYKPHPILDGNDEKKLEKKEDRAALIKIAIAFACMGNIMLLSISLYGGATGDLSNQFRYYTFFLSLPVLLFSAKPFYISGLNAIKNRVFSMDIPISLALFIGALMGCYGLVSGQDLIFFDSLTMLVFLLLTSRFVLKRVQRNILNSSNLSSLYENTSVRKRDEDSGKFIDTYSSYLKVNDRVLISEGALIPVDGTVFKGRSAVNNSLITGESCPVPVAERDTVYSGSKNIENEIELIVTAVGKKTRLGQILERIEAGWGKASEMRMMTERLSKRFTTSLLVIASLTFVLTYYFINLEEALIRSLALLIITCPCALAISGPLTMSLGLGKLLGKGIYIKNESVIERLLKIKRIYLDKTGTLTYGEFRVESILFEKHISSKEETRLLQILFSLESRSEHPVAKSMRNYLLSEFESKGLGLKELKITQFSEVPGVGVLGTFETDTFKVVKSKEQSKELLNQIDFYQGDKIIAKIKLKDQLRSEAKSSVRKIMHKGIEPFIVSGDKKSIVHSIAREVGIPKDNLFADISPEQKHDLVGDEDGVMMVGDGVNDSMALSRAYIGVSVEGSAEISLKVSDIYLSKGGIYNVVGLFDISAHLHKIIYLNLSISLFYNLIGASLTIMGVISPLLCAVLMPLSSFCVILISILGTRQITRKL